MSDAIFVSGLALHAYHGVMPHEAKVGQTFKLDLTLGIDLAAASRSDKLVDTVSYDKAAAGAVAEALLGQFAQITSVRVTVHKPHAPIAATFDDVGITIERMRRG